MRAAIGSLVKEGMFLTKESETSSSTYLFDGGVAGLGIHPVQFLHHSLEGFSDGVDHLAGGGFGGSVEES